MFGTFFFFQGNVTQTCDTCFLLLFLHFCFHAVLKFNISILKCTCLWSMGMSWHLRPCWWLRIMPQEPPASGTPVVTVLESEEHDVTRTMPASVACTCGHGVLQTETAIEGYVWVHDTNRARDYISVWGSTYHQRQCRFPLTPEPHMLGWSALTPGYILKFGGHFWDCGQASVRDFVVLHTSCCHQGQITTQSLSYHMGSSCWAHQDIGGLHWHMVPWWQ